MLNMHGDLEPEEHHSDDDWPRDHHVNDLWEDMDQLNMLYEELMWSHDDELEFIIENGRIVIFNKTHEDYIHKTH